MIYFFYTLTSKKSTSFSLDFRNNFYNHTVMKRFFYFLSLQKMDELSTDVTLDSLWMWYEGMSTGSIVVTLAFLVWTIICRWKMFQKAGLPGWGAIIPFYNFYLRFKMAWMSWWWVLSILLPPVFAIAIIVSYFKIPSRFGKHWAWGLWLWFLNPIFIWIFAFDKSEYNA